MLGGAPDTAGTPCAMEPIEAVTAPGIPLEVAGNIAEGYAAPPGIVYVCIAGCDCCGSGAAKDTVPDGYIVGGVAAPTDPIVACDAGMPPHPAPLVEVCIRV
mmetsp:Transcript_35250/g.81279  ORF Transcript_35250/g.81279 Transcript_35250/m.81279 type:complete len:102 (-) Transcript_35250:638-943(-)